MFLMVNCESLGGWWEKSWSRLATYYRFVKDLGKLNLGLELHENRFVGLRRVEQLTFTPLKCGLTSSMLEVKHKMISPYFLEIRSTLRVFVFFYS